MSTPTPAPKDERIEQLLGELRARLAEIDFENARIGPVERSGDGATVTIELDAMTTDEPRPVTTTFEEDLEYVLNKNRELYRRLS